MEKQPINCDIWCIVDFGKGPVEMRCTEVGDHTEHRVEVEIEFDPDSEPVGEEIPIRNIFKEAG